MESKKDCGGKVCKVGAHQNNTNREYCATENLAGKIQFMIGCGALICTLGTFSPIFYF
jgi:hypothetical protein